MGNTATAQDASDRTLRRKLRRTRLVTALVTSGATAIAVGGFAYAAIPGSNGVITACYRNDNGAVRVINVGAQHCGPKETKLVWNQKGVAGPKGATGARGPIGPKGDPGGDSLVGSNCTWQDRPGYVAESISQADDHAVQLVCNPVFYVDYDGSTNVSTPMPATVTGGQKGPGCTPATLSCHNTTDFVTNDTVHVTYACTSSCPVSVGSTITWFVNTDLGGGGTGNEYPCTVVEAPAGTLGCSIDIEMSNWRVLGIHISHPTIS